ncbi:hypothetical protein [Pseudomonas luteola]|uniref:hypothetical protein n=1 Tax=Pseudomonas luteola TaxID=47886 RepID=UPI0012396DE7|nr:MULTISPECIES: hypothetical protein [Pseudomonas]MBA1249831.1 hypothetical protein [Pseudomonas zeshuii]QEU28857.1 hypothetical protein FOB45_14150 [Pseudomonas luteola]
MNAERLMKMKSSFDAVKGIRWEDAPEEIQREWTTCWDLAIASVTIDLPQNPWNLEGQDKLNYTQGINDARDAIIRAGLKA